MISKIQKILIIFAVILSLLPNLVSAEDKAKRVAILELEAKNAPKPYAEIIRDLLEVKLQKSRLFDVLERNQIKMILNEQKFQLNDCSDSICAVQIGKILYADFVIVGSLSKIAKYNLSVKIVDVKNGSIMLADTESAETDAELDKAAASIVDRISRDIQSNNYGAKIYTINDNLKKNENPIDFGVYYRYGIIQNMAVPSLKVPDSYPEPYKIVEKKVNAPIMELMVAPSIGLNNYIKFRSDIKYGWGLENNQARDFNSKSINNTYNSGTYWTYLWGLPSYNFKSLGIGLNVLFEYPFRKLVPYISIGCGYSYYWDKNKNEISSFDTAYNVSSNYIVENYQLVIENQGRILFSQIEIGFIASLNEQTGFTISGIYNYTIYGNIFNNIKIRKTGSSGNTSLIPAEYQNLDKKIDTSGWEKKRLAPIWYLQLGFVHRL
jgi:hypothetical protein